MLTLRTVTRTTGANAALKDGRVRPAGAALDLVEVPVLPRAFRRMVRGLEFDVCEMALTTYLVARAHGVAMTALPVFLVRGFHHGAIQVREGSDVRAPRDLEGRRVGVQRGYTVTTGVWARGVLSTEHGVDLDQVTWVLSGDEHVAAYRPPPNVVALDAGRELEEALLAGDLAAVVGADLHHPAVVPLLPDPRDAALAAVRRQGFSPINHLVVVRDELLAAHPWLAESLVEAFMRAKQPYLEVLRGGSRSGMDGADLLHRQVMEALDADPLPYGLDANRRALETLLDHALHQHILTQRPALGDLFAGADITPTPEPSR